VRGYRLVSSATKRVSSRQAKVLKLWNHLELSRGSIDGFPNLVEERRSRIAKKSCPFANVHNSIRFEPHQSRAGGIGSDRIVGEHDFPEEPSGTVESAVSFHCYDPIRDHEVNRNSGAQIEDAFLDAFPVENILRPSVSRRLKPAQVSYAEADTSPVERSNLLFEMR